MMERIEERSMSKFVLSSFINLGIGLGFGLIVGIIATIVTHGIDTQATMLYVTLGVAAFITLFTRNLYRIYFNYRLSLDINAMCEGDGEESESFLSAFVLSLLTFGMYRVYWTYKLAKRLRANAPRYGFKMEVTGKEIAALDVICFGFVSAYELIKNTNEAAAVYNQNGLAGIGEGGVQ